jgi:hypothetical protein
MDMDSTTSSVAITTRPRKRRPAPARAAATITVTVTTTRDGIGWMHQLEARSADELRQVIACDVDQVIQHVWGGV